MTLDALRQAFQHLLRADALSIVLGIVITAFGIATLAIHAARAQSRSKELLWVGVFSATYGIRLLGKTPVVWLLFDQSEEFWRYFETTFSNFIMIPAVLFTMQVYGPGWRSGMRWIGWLAAIYAVLATAVNAARGEPGFMPDAGGVFILVLVPFALAGAFAGYRPPPMPHARAFLIGLSLFALTFLNEHLINLQVLPWKTRFEAVGFFALISAMGYVAIRQSFDNEQVLRVLEEEMRSATRIQNSILPRSIPVLENARICVRYTPMTAVAGDFYEFVETGPRTAGVAIVDVAGHGVPAALVASMVKVAIDAQAASTCDPAALMAGLNDIMCRQARGNLITAAYLFLDFANAVACCAAAAHPPILLRRRTSETLVELRETGLILGVLPGQLYEPMRFDLFSGDRIVLYTDGISEAANEQDELFGEVRFPRSIAEGDHLDTEAFAEHLLADVRAWSSPTGKGQADDMTLMVIDID